MSLRGRGQESGLKAALLDWCKNRIGHYKGVQLTNLTTSWKDGLAFCALVHSIDPTALDYDSLSPKEGLKNCRIAFAAAAKLGISALLDAEDVADIDVPEPLSMMTYISQYYHHVNGTGRNWNGSLRGASPAPPESAAVSAARGHGLMRGSVDISAMELKRMRSEEPSGAKPAAGSSGAAPAQEKAAPVSYIPRPDLARTGSFRGSALGRQQGLSNGRAASPSPLAAEKHMGATSLAPPAAAPAGLARQVSTPVMRTDDQRAAEERRKQEEARVREEKRKAEEEVRAQEERKRKQQAEEAERQRAQAEAKRRETEQAEARALAEKRKSEEAERERRKREAQEKEEAAKRAKVQQEAERRQAEQRQREEEERRRADEKRQRQRPATGAAQALPDEEERKRARLARWATESAQDAAPTEATLTVTNSSTQTARSAGGPDGEIRIKCLDDGAEWVVPVTTVSQVGFEGAVKTKAPARAAAPAPAPSAAEAQGGSSCVVM